MVFLLIAYIDFSTPPLKSLTSYPHTSATSFLICGEEGDCALGFSIICRQLSNANAKLTKIIYCIFNSARAVSLARIVLPNRSRILGKKKRKENTTAETEIQRYRERERDYSIEMFICFKGIKKQKIRM